MKHNIWFQPDTCWNINYMSTAELHDSLQANHQL